MIVAVERQPPPFTWYPTPILTGNQSNASTSKSFRLFRKPQSANPTFRWSSHIADDHHHYCNHRHRRINRHTAHGPRVDCAQLSEEVDGSPVRFAGLQSKCLRAETSTLDPLRLAARHDVGDPQSGTFGLKICSHKLSNPNPIKVDLWFVR